MEGHPRLAMLMASRPALAPLLDVLERSCRSAKIQQLLLCEKVNM